MGDATQALRLLEELERLEDADGLERVGPPPAAGEDAPMTVLLAMLVKDDFDLSRIIVDSANDA